MHMDLDGKLAGVKKKYLLLGVPVVIVAALFLRHRASSSSSATDTTGTDTTGTTDGGVPNPTTGSTVAGSGDGSMSGINPATDPTVDTTGIADPYQQEVGDLLEVFRGFQASAGTSSAPATTDQPVQPQTSADHIEKTTREKAKPLVSPALVKRLKFGGAIGGTTGKPHSTPAHPASHHAAPAGPHTHVTAATPSHAKPGTLGQRQANASKTVPVKKPVAGPKRPTPKPPKKPAAVRRNAR